MKKIVRTVLDYFFLLRIPLLAPVWTIFILGWVTGDDATRVGGWLTNGTAALAGESRMWLALIGFSLIVASIYVVNQIMDIESDRINHKLFFLPQGIISIRAAWICALLCIVTGAAIGWFCFDRVFFVLFGVCLIVGILYNLPPFSLKNRAWGGVVSNFIGHGLLTYLAGWYIARTVSHAGEIEIGQGLWAALSPGFANAAVFITTTIADEDGDRSTGKRTFCVKYGHKLSALAAMACCGAALLCTFTIEHHQWVMAIPAAVSLAFFIALYAAPRRENAFKAFKWPVFLLTAFVALIVPLYGALILATFFGSRLYYRRRFNIEYPSFKTK
jgi:4-hydroxybenzoate polyprenyltransferase